MIPRLAANGRPQTQGMDIRRRGGWKNPRIHRGQQQGQRQTRAKSIKHKGPSIDGKILGNVTGKKLADVVKHVYLKPWAQWECVLPQVSLPLSSRCNAASCMYLEDEQPLSEEHENSLPSDSPLLSHSLLKLQLQKNPRDSVPFKNQWFMGTGFLPVWKSRAGDI